MNDLSEFSPEQLQQLIELGVIDDQGNMLRDQLKQAHMLRNGQAPQGRDLGYTYVAANPLEHVASAYEKYDAGKKIDELRGKQTELMDKQTAARKMFLEAMMLRGSQPQQGGPPNLGPMNPMIGA